eukprot:TRINITY_DN26277_c0_g1_i2.p1 TRINITY_DN26277_c0_g1~~TRINITY_DN26277_c0_g1_i2.p1  ORF type:complete len:350 (+),score=97.17 TRINITY_DN26277_c0_g1_i2:104-1051(+)
MAARTVATAGAARAEYAEAEAEVQRLEEELEAARRDAASARRAGATVLGALEAAMAPLMAELAVERRRALAAALPSEAPRMDCSGDAAALAAEVQRLQGELAAQREEVERLQAAERKRGNELRRLRVDATDAMDSLGYEQQRVRHYEVGLQLGFEPTGDGWAGLGPSGMGRRTMEVRAEKRLRETAEQRASRIAQQVVKLSSEASSQQGLIAHLSKRFLRLRRLSQSRDKQLAGSSSDAGALEEKLREHSRNVAKLLESLAGENLLPEEQPSVISEGGLASDAPDKYWPKTLSQQKLAQPRSKTASTGRLPQLSF